MLSSLTAPGNSNENSAHCFLHTAEFNYKAYHFYSSLFFKLEVLLCVRSKKTKLGTTETRVSPMFQEFGNLTGWGGVTSNPFNKGLNDRRIKEVMPVDEGEKRGDVGAGSPWFGTLWGLALKLLHTRQLCHRHNMRYSEWKKTFTFHTQTHRGWLCSTEVYVPEWTGQVLRFQQMHEGWAHVAGDTPVEWSDGAAAGWQALLRFDGCDGWWLCQAQFRGATYEGYAVQMAAQF